MRAQMHSYWISWWVWVRVNFRFNKVFQGHYHINKNACKLPGTRHARADYGE